MLEKTVVFLFVFIFFLCEVCIVQFSFYWAKEAECNLAMNKFKNVPFFFFLENHG